MAQRGGDAAASGGLTPGTLDASRLAAGGTACSARKAAPRLGSALRKAAAAQHFTVSDCNPCHPWRRSLYGNQFDGVLPLDWGQAGSLARLETLYLDRNFLSGSLPPQWAADNASWPHLRTL